MVFTIVLGYFTSVIVRLTPSVPMTGHGFVVPTFREVVGRPAVGT